MKNEKLDKCILKSDNGIYIDLHVSPNSKKNSIKDVNKWRNELKVSIKSEAKKGEANKELKNFLSDLLDISIKKIKITKGRTSKRKRVFVSDIHVSEISSKIKI